MNHRSCPDNLRHFRYPQKTREEYGVLYSYNRQGFRAPEFDSIDFPQPMILALGDSHTEGAGNHVGDIWSSRLAESLRIPVINLGQAGCSTDCVARLMPISLDYFRPKAVCLLAPDYSRFEIFKDDRYHQILPTDTNRIYYMETVTEEWLQKNWEEQISKIRRECQLRNVDIAILSLYDLIDIIDHADRWPQAVNHSHYDVEWHRLVAEIFRYKLHQLK